MLKTSASDAAPAFIVLILAAATLAPAAGYRAKPWSLRPPDGYPARLTSEGVTIAVEPLYRDSLAAQVFDKNDMVTRGIMPLGIIVFNDNDFPIVVEGDSIELICDGDRFRTLTPDETVKRLFPATTRSIRSPLPIPTGNPEKARDDAWDDLDHKFLGDKLIPARGKGGGFLYLKVPPSKDMGGLLAAGRVYIPEVYRHDTGKNLVFFEVDVKPALDAAGRPR